MNMQAIFALESHMDRMAMELGVDPLDFRMKNYATYQSVGTAEAHLTGDGTTTFAAKIPYSKQNP